jgi:hypothetical protein
MTGSAQSLDEGVGRIGCTDFARICSPFGSDSRPSVPVWVLMVFQKHRQKRLILLAYSGAGGENRTHDLPLTKGLRYHYATPAPSGERPGPVL